MSFVINSYDESWGEHTLVKSYPQWNLPLADIKAVVAMTARELVDRAITNEARNLQVNPLPRSSYVDGFTIEYQNKDDDFHHAYAVVVEPINQEADQS
jgi:hypothetical protein